MRIGLVSSEFPPFGGGGIGTYTAAIADALAQLDHEIHVIANAWHDIEPAPLEERRGNVYVHRVRGLRRDYQPDVPHAAEANVVGQIYRRWIGALFWSWLAAQRLERLHRQLPLDIVEFPECFAESYVAIGLRRTGLAFSDLPMTLTLHSPLKEIAHFNELERQQVWVRRGIFMEEMIMRRADGLSCPSRSLLKRVAQRQPHCVSADVIPNPLDETMLERLPQRDVGQQYLLYVGRLEPRKGVRQLVRSVVPLFEEYPALRLELVGKDCPAGTVPGNMIAALRRLIPERFAKRVNFTSMMARTDLRQRYANASACVFPAPWDNFPYSCAEAMACGAYVIASNNSGMSEMVEHGRSGFVVDSADANAVRAEIRRALDGPHDEIRQNAQERIRRLCDPLSVAQQRIAHYRRVMGAARKLRQSQRMRKVEMRLQELSVLVLGNGECSRLERTLVSLREAAGQTSLRLNVFAGVGQELVGSDTVANISLLHGDSEDIWFAQWTARVSTQRADLLLKLHVGETIDAEYLSATLEAMLRDERVSWATTWALPADEPELGPYCGWDFSSLDITDYRPIPFALIRGEHLRQVGGWNNDLPEGWRDWDLWLALAQQGLQGQVIPSWLARYTNSGALNLTPPAHRKSHELVIEKIAARNGGFFKANAQDIWMAAQLGHISPPHRRQKPKASEKCLDLLGHINEAYIEAPEDFVRPAYFFDDYGSEFLLAHPPTRVCYDVDLTELTYLNLALAMHPSVYDCQGGALRFVVKVSGETVLNEIVDAKNDPGQRGWKALTLDLKKFSGGVHRLELITEGAQAHQTDFCSGGWGSPTLTARPLSPSPKGAQYNSGWCASSPPVSG